MVCSHYIATARTNLDIVKYIAIVYSFDEALWNFNNWREDKECCTFEITYPVEEYLKGVKSNE